MAWTQNTCTSSTGAQLNYYSKLPKGKPKAILQINHGMAEQASRYERFAGALAKAGYGTYAHDHRGHGATTAPDMQLGSFAKSDGWNKVIADVHAMNTLIKSENPDVPVIAFGHSMGAIVTLSYILNHPQSISASAIWNSGVETGALGFVLKTVLKIQRMFLGSDVPSSLIKKLTFDTWNKEFSPNRTEFDWLSRDETEVDKYVADPLCGFNCTIGLWIDLVQGIYFGADNSNLANLPNALPVHLQAGAKDPCSNHGKAVANIAKRMKNAGLNDVTLNILSDTRHESLNEINRDQTTAEFIEWLDKRF